MISFSLKEPISYQKLVQEIDNLIKKQIKNQKQAESTVLVIRLTEITQVIDSEIKKIEA